jgi:hypothetical protein
VDQAPAFILSRLKPKLVYVVLKNSVRTSKRTQLVTITNINLLTLLEVIPVYAHNFTEPIYKNTELLIIKAVLHIITIRL